MKEYRNNANELVNAFEYYGYLKGSNGKYIIPKWAIKAVKDGLLYRQTTNNILSLYVNTADGDFLVSIGDYIVYTQKDGMLHYRKEDFEKDYYLVDYNSQFVRLKNIYTENKNIIFHYTYLSSQLELQANSFGYTLGNKQQELDNLRISINCIKGTGLATDKQVETMLKRLDVMVRKNLSSLR